MNATSMANVLVIKHGALGDVVLATGPFAAIQRHHAGDRLTLLTTDPFADLARRSGLFDDVWIDRRPRWWQWSAVWELRNRLRAGRFERVYDLQTSDRTGAYWRLLGYPKPEWSGIVAGCSHPHATPHRGRLHTVERQAEQLALAGIANTPAPNLEWLTADIGRFALPGRFALLVPGGAAHRPAKRWPVERYAQLARWLAARAFVPVLIGTQAEGAVLSAIAAAEPTARNLCQDTSFAEIAQLARGAVAAVGNDTGPMHLIATARCASVVLFSAASDPARTAPRGLAVEVVRVDDLATLPLDRVRAALASVAPGVGAAP